MPVRPFSVGSFFLVSSLALLAAGRTAAAAPKETAKPPPPPQAAEGAPPEPHRDAEPPPRAGNPAAEPPPPTAPAAPRAAPAPVEPVGFSDRLFIRSPGGEVVIFPGARVQVDGAAFPRQTPKSGVFLRRARVGVRGWLGRIFYFDSWADFTPLPPGSEGLA